MINRNHAAGPNGHGQIMSGYHDALRGTIKLLMLPVTSLRSWFIRHTMRETLLYKNVVCIYSSLMIYRSKLFRGHFVRKARLRQYLSTHDKIKIHVGCGGKHPESFLNTDLLGDVPLDITDPLPFDDGSVDFLYSSHVIEHIYRKEFEQFLIECHRVLKDGGQMVHATPSMEKIWRILYGEDEKKRRVLLDDQKNFSFDDIMTPSVYINGESHILFGHKFLYDFELLTVLGERYGFSVERIPNQEAERYIGSEVQPKDSRWDLETETFLFTKKPIDL